MCEGCLGLKGSECEAHLVDWPVGKKKHWDKLCVVGSLAVLCDISWTSCKGLELSFQRAHDCANWEREGRVTFPVRPKQYYLYVHMQDVPHDRWRSRINPTLERKTYSYCTLFQSSERSPFNNNGPSFCYGVNLDGRLLKNVSGHFSLAMIDADCSWASLIAIDFFTQVNRCHVFACPTWPQAKATIWQLNDFVRWKHKICALSSWKGTLIVVFSADPFVDELSLVMFFLDVGSRFVSWSGSACRCFANWACLETVVTARRNRGERRSQWLTFHLTLQVNSFRWCSYMHEESHGRRFTCGTSYDFNLPWQAYVMCKISYVVNYIYDKHQDSFKTDIFCHFDFCGSLWTYSPLLHLKFPSESDELVRVFRVPDKASEPSAPMSIRWKKNTGEPKGLALQLVR